MNDGRIIAADIQCYVNGGCTPDESEMVSPSKLPVTQQNENYFLRLVHPKSTLVINVSMEIMFASRINQ